MNKLKKKRPVVWNMVIKRSWGMAIASPLVSTTEYIYIHYSIHISNNFYFSKSEAIRDVVPRC